MYFATLTQQNASCQFSLFLLNFISFSSLRHIVSTFVRKISITGSNGSGRRPGWSSYNASNLYGSWHDSWIYWFWLYCCVSVQAMCHLPTVPPTDLYLWYRWELACLLRIVKLHKHINGDCRNLNFGPVLCPGVPWLSPFCLDVWHLPGRVQLCP